MESIFARRLEMIRPTLSELQSIGAEYIRHVEPSAKEMVSMVREEGWTVAIVSGGFTQAIRPLADFLGISRVEAVELQFDPHKAFMQGLTRRVQLRERRVKTKWRLSFGASFRPTSQ